ncbi:MAG: primosomal protein N' [Myxococcales bacterium]|nr:primosomal protein N' [Myxococcales bacterium]
MNSGRNGASPDPSPAARTAVWLADVAIPVPLGTAFSYTVPDALRAQIVPGSRVLCELGRRKVAAVVLAVGERVPDFAAERLKPIAGLLDEEPVLPLELLRFLEELARYYYAPIGEVLRLALPAVERDRLAKLSAQGELLDGRAPGHARAVGRVVSFASATDLLEQSGTLRGQSAAVLAYLRANGETKIAGLTQRYGNARSAIAKLSSLGLVVCTERIDRTTGARFTSEVARDSPHEPTEAQAASGARIAESLARGAAKTFLLVGVTGSGKTEVYMRAIAECRARGKTAIVLVPEIALTPQLVGRFRARFGDEVGVLHSALPDAARHRMWRELRDGTLRIAVGARSALFAPVSNVGLIVVDEEHDGSYKQEEGVRYHARDMALLRAHRAGATCLLGSATPSLESVALCQKGRAERLDLPERATRASLPDIEIVDLRRIGAGPTGDRFLSLPLYRALAATLAAGEQSIVFLNRRGFAPAVVCESCGVLKNCELCSVALTFHRVEERLRCHTCDFSARLPKSCACGSAKFALDGLGTEKLEAALASAFPSARVGRLDRDVASGTRSAAIIEKMRAGELDILVGTQMVTKGHDLPRVTLVGVVNADTALGMPDFRAAERGFQLLVQVAGRAGRHERRGRVVIQTYNPAHPALTFAARHDVDGFLAAEIIERELAGYPPHRRLALLRVSAVDEAVARTAAARLAASARSSPAVSSRLVEVLGPAPAPIARKRNRFRFRVLLRARDRVPLRSVLDLVKAAALELARTVRFVIDVDPVSML